MANHIFSTAKIVFFLSFIKCFGEKKAKTVVTTAAVFRFSSSKCKRTADLSIAYWKKQIVLCPNINDNNKECCKEFVETMVKKELGKLKMELEEVVIGQCYFSL